LTGTLRARRAGCALEALTERLHSAFDLAGQRGCRGAVKTIEPTQHGFDHAPTHRIEACSTKRVQVVDPGAQVLPRNVTGQRHRGWPRLSHPSPPPSARPWAP